MRRDPTDLVPAEVEAPAPMLPVDAAYWEPAGAGERAAEEWSFGPTDMALLAALLATAAALCAPVALRLRAETRRAEQAREASAERVELLREELRTAEARSEAQRAAWRRMDRSIAALEAGAGRGWTTILTELSRLRPSGLWTLRISGKGSRFRAELAAQRPELVVKYVERLRQSPHVDFAGLPAGEAPSTRASVVGRLTGE